MAERQTRTGIVFGFTLLGILLGVAIAVWLMVTPPAPDSSVSPSMRGLLITLAFVGTPIPFVLLGLKLGRRSSR